MRARPSLVSVLQIVRPERPLKKAAPDKLLALISLDMEKWSEADGHVHRALEAIEARGLFQALLRIGTEVEMHVHTISADGPTVLTERTDVLQWGRLRVQFWICGRFEVHDGQIVEWREYYDPLAILAATLRGLLGVVVPAARAKPPSAV